MHFRMPALKIAQKRAERNFRLATFPLRPFLLLIRMFRGDKAGIFPRRPVS